MRNFLWYKKACAVCAVVLFLLYSMQKKLSIIFEKNVIEGNFYQIKIRKTEERFSEQKIRPFFRKADG